MLNSLVSEYKDKGNYDCIVPFSGGKDSTFQLWYIVKILKITDTHKKSDEMEKLFKGSKEEYGRFDPADFKFHTLKKIQIHKNKQLDRIGYFDTPKYLVE